MGLETLNYLVALGTVAMQIATIALLALFFVRADFPRLTAFIERWALWGAFLLSAACVVMSLVYSEYFGLVPCSLCWFQRIFIYPQAVLFFFAALRKDYGVWLYSIALSILGGIIALYQHYIQMVGESPLPCPAGGGDCVKRIIFEFGYITFPLISFSAFVFLIVLMFYVRRPSTPR